MDDNIRRRRQNEPPIHAASSSRYQQPLQDPSQQRRSFAGTPPDRYRPAAINTSPSAGARAMGGSAGYSGYYPEPAATAFSTPTMPQGAMGYHQSADYGQDTRQTQSFASTYNPTAIMYNVQQAGAQNPVYDTSQQFSSRQPAGLQMMPTDVAGPYFPSEPTNTATASNMQPQAASSSTPTGVYQQSPADRAALLQNYSSGMTTMSGLTAQTGPTPDVSMEQQDYPPASSGIDEAYASYQTALKEIFQNVRNGGLVAASESLLHVSDWLLSHVVELGMGSPPPLDPGLVTDEQHLHEDRMNLWNDFNHAWLSLLQRQKEMMEPGQQLQPSQTIIAQEGLEKMGKELVRLCDSIERHGLVDYQYGVWEEQIMDVLTECLDHYDPPEDSGGTATASSSQQR